jgi:hypothetical protein
MRMSHEVESSPTLSSHPALVGLRIVLPTPAPFSMHAQLKNSLLVQPPKAPIARIFTLVNWLPKALLSIASPADPPDHGAPLSTSWQADLYCSRVYLA